MEAGPSVLTVMTPFPVHAPPDTSVIAAQALMKGHEVRHLPIQRNGHVIGVVSESDLQMATDLLGGSDFPVWRLCTKPPLVVHTEAPVRAVIAEMADLGVDAAVVLRQGRLAGIVTLTDICEALLRMLPGPFLDEPDADGVA